MENHEINVDIDDDDVALLRDKAGGSSGEDGRRVVRKTSHGRPGNTGSSMIDDDGDRRHANRKHKKQLTVQEIDDRNGSLCTPISPNARDKNTEHADCPLKNSP